MSGNYPGTDRNYKARKLHNFDPGRDHSTHHARFDGDLPFGDAARGDKPSRRYCRRKARRGKF
jgi:hypothetical protein